MPASYFGMPYSQIAWAQDLPRDLGEQAVVLVTVVEREGEHEVRREPVDAGDGARLHALPVGREPGVAVTAERDPDAVSGERAGGRLRLGDRVSSALSTSQRASSPRVPRRPAGGSSAGTDLDVVRVRPSASRRNGRSGRAPARAGRSRGRLRLPRPDGPRRLTGIPLRLGVLDVLERVHRGQ